MSTTPTPDEFAAVAEDEAASAARGATFPLYRSPEVARAATERTERLYSRGNPVRNVRLDDGRWTAITDLAARTGRTASDVMRDALDGYLDRRP